MVKDNEDKICSALFQDLGKHGTEAFRDELGLVLRSATVAINCLDKWAVPKHVRTNTYGISLSLGLGHLGDSTTNSFNHFIWLDNCFIGAAKTEQPSSVVLPSKRESDIRTVWDGSCSV